MTQRERYLAIGVAVVVGLFGTQYVFSMISGTLRQKQDAVDIAAKEIDAMNRTITSGKIATRKIETLVPKSLPTDQETLIARYRDWLFSLGKAVGMTDIDIAVPLLPSSRASAYNAYVFTLNGVCRTEKALDLLAKFYDKDCLHSVKEFKMTPTKDSNLVTIVLTSQAIALTAAQPKQELSNESSGRLAMTAEEYRSTILNRNPFAAPNKAPEFTGDRVVSIERGKPWSLTLEARDPESHFVSFDLMTPAEDLPKGMQFRRGSLSWNPAENGEYEIVVKATDNGWPNKSTERKLAFKVVDPPPAPVEGPKFDVATQAFFSAMVTGINGPQASIRSRTDGKTIELNEGTEFELGTIKAKVVSINLGEAFVELESASGRWTVGMGTSLADAFRKSQVD